MLVMIETRFLAIGAFRHPALTLRAPMVFASRIGTEPRV
jgi:hypothetical protein